MDNAVVDKQPIPGAKVWNRQGELLTHELTALTHRHVTSLIEEARRASSVEHHIELQRQLAAAGWDARALALQVKDRKKALRVELREAKGRGEMERVAEISRILRDFDLTLDVNQRCWYALRAVQDGIVWRLLAHDRHRISVLNQGTPVTTLSASFPSECAAAETHWAEGRLAIFCDLSNCINSGDLLVFEPDNQRIVVTEVKESGRGEDSSQMRAARIKVEFLNSGTSDVLADAPVLGPDRLPVLKTHLGVLADVLKRAARQGMAMAKVGEAATVYAFDARAVDWSDAEAELRRFQARERAFGSRLGLAWAGSPTLYQWDSVSRVRRDESHASGIIAPYSIFPLDAEICAALLLGIIGYRTVLNVDVIESYFAKKGWSILRPREGDRFAEGFLWLRREKGVVQVPFALAEQMLIELLSLSAFEKSVMATWERIMDAPDEKVHVAWAWADEARVWL